MRPADYAALVLLPHRLGLLEDILLRLDDLTSNVRHRTPLAVLVALRYTAWLTRQELEAERTRLSKALPRRALQRISEIARARQLVEIASQSSSLSPEVLSLTIAAAQRPLPREQAEDLANLLETLLQTKR